MRRAEPMVVRGAVGSVRTAGRLLGAAWVSRSPVAGVNDHVRQRAEPSELTFAAAALTQTVQVTDEGRAEAGVARPAQDRAGLTRTRAHLQRGVAQFRERPYEGLTRQPGGAIPGSRDPGTVDPRVQLDDLDLPITGQVPDAASDQPLVRAGHARPQRRQLGG